MSNQERICKMAGRGNGKKKSMGKKIGGAKKFGNTAFGKKIMKRKK